MKMLQIRHHLISKTCFDFDLQKKDIGIKFILFRGGDVGGNHVTRKIIASVESPSSKISVPKTATNIAAFVGWRGS